MSIRCKMLTNVIALIFSVGLNGKPLHYNKPVQITSQQTKSRLWIHPSHWKNSKSFCEVFGGDPFYQRDQNDSQLFILKNKQNRNEQGPVKYEDEIELYSLGHGGFRSDGFKKFIHPKRLTVNTISRHGMDSELVVDLDSKLDVSLSSTFVAVSASKREGIIQQGDPVFIVSKLCKKNVWQHDSSRFGKDFKEYLVGDEWGRQNPGLGDRSQQQAGIFVFAHVEKKKSDKKKDTQAFTQASKKKKRIPKVRRWASVVQRVKKRWISRIKLLSQKRKERRLRKKIKKLEKSHENA